MAILYLLSRPDVDVRVRGAWPRPAASSASRLINRRREASTTREALPGVSAQP